MFSQISAKIFSCCRKIPRLPKSCLIEWSTSMSIFGMTNTGSLVTPVPYTKTCLTLFRLNCHTVSTLAFCIRSSFKIVITILSSVVLGANKESFGYAIYEQAPIFKEVNEGFLRVLSMKIHQDIYMPYQIIIKRGDFGNEMFYIRKGYVEVTVLNSFLTGRLEISPELKKNIV